MKHYEVIIMIHPDQNDQVKAMIEKYREIIEKSKGIVHRLENWGRCQLAYSIKKLHKAHYVLMNIECDKEPLSQLQEAFRYNDAVLRHVELVVDKAETEPSITVQQQKSTSQQEKEYTPNRRKKAGILETLKNIAIDYKDIKLLKNYITETGKIVPGRITGVSAKLQRTIARAIKRARYVALLPYCDQHK